MIGMVELVIALEGCVTHFVAHLTCGPSCSKGRPRRMRPSGGIRCGMTTTSTTTMPMKRGKVVSSTR